MLLPRLRRPSEKPLLGVFLTATLLLCGWLAYQAVDAARSQRRTAEGVLVNYADIAVSEYTREVDEELDDFLDDIFDDIPRRSDRAELPHPRIVFFEMARGLRRIPCRCPAIEDGSLYLRLDLPEGRLETLTADADPAQLDAFEAAIRAHHAAEPSVRSGLFVTESNGVYAGPAVIAYVVSRSDRDVPRALYGLVMDAEGVSDLFHHWYSSTQLIPEVIAAGLPNDSLVSVSVRSADGTTLYESAARFPSTYSAMDTLSPELGALMLDAAVRPDAAEHLIIGGLPASRVPLLTGLLLLTMGLGVAALYQLYRQQQLARLREDFVSGVSHEFRTPLAQIRLFAELLRDGKLDGPGPRDRAMSVINREASRLTHLVENVLRFSEIQHGESATIQLEDFSIAEVVAEVLEAFGPLAQDRGMSIRADVEAAGDMRGSRSAVYQILTNLVDNAMKYGPDDQTILVGATRRDGSVQLTVEDEGPGVPKAQRDRIWEPYQRLQEDVRGHVRGTGIGLAVVADLATMFGGSAWVEERDGPGSRFVVELADQPADAAPDETRTDSLAATA